MLKVILLVVFLGLHFQVAARTIRVGVVEQNLTVLNVVNGKFIGSKAKLLQCIFDKSGVDFELQLLPEPRVLNLLASGELNIGLPLSRLPVRDNYATFVEPFAYITYVLYTTKDIDLSADLSAYRFVAVRGSSRGGGLFTQRKVQFEEVNSRSQALELVRIGRFDGVIVPGIVVQGINPDLLAGLKSIDVGVVPISLYVSKKAADSEKLAVVMNSAIELCAQ